MANKNLTSDLPDSERDKIELQPDEAILDLPDVKDIPGQEFVHVPNMSEMADTTISSDDEEGIGLFDEDNSGERLASGEELSEDELIIGDNGELDPELDEEESDEAFGDDDEVTGDPAGDDSDVTDEERKLLEHTEDVDSEDNENLYNAELDDTDLDGDKLNENDDDVSGNDLDVPGADEDNADEAIGEEDEENNDYSLEDDE